MWVAMFQESAVEENKTGKEEKYSIKKNLLKPCRRYQKKALRTPPF